jgi:hypothetical protein
MNIFLQKHDTPTQKRRNDDLPENMPDPFYAQEGDGILPYTLIELKMLHILEEIKSKEQWYEKVFNEEIVSKWRNEAKTEKFITPDQFQYIIDELRYYARLPNHGDKPKINGALKINEWLEYMESKELTIADIEAMKPGEKLEVIQLHRNLGDVVLDVRVNPYGVAIPAVKFFEGVGGIYTHSHDMHGRFIDVPDECELGETEFNFHLNYKDRMWYPLKDNGCIPIADFPTPYYADPWIRGMKASIDYRMYPKSAKVGMRGPMLKLSDVKNAPPVYHYRQKFFF